MQHKNLAIVLFATFLAFCSLYTPQPLLPLLSRQFAVSPADAALLISIPMLMLGFVPIVFGYVLQSLSARTVLRVAMALLALATGLIYFVEQYGQLLALRAAQGLLLPAIFTALMTYCAALAPHGKVRQYMAFYIATTILGGFSGRALGGAVATLYDWRVSFLLLAVLLAVCTVFLQRLDSDKRSTYAKPGLSAYARVWQSTGQRGALLTIFLFFFTFSALLNTLPFRLVDLAPDISEFAISTSYIGYLAGGAVALSAEKILRLLGGQRSTLRLVFVAYPASLLLFLIPSAPFALWFLFCVSAIFFLLHALMSGLVNAQAGDDGSVVNGLYVACYYAGGSLGAWLAPLAYHAFGWNGLIALFCAVIACAWFSAAPLRHAGQ